MRGGVIVDMCRLSSRVPPPPLGVHVGAVTGNNNDRGRVNALGACRASFWATFDSEP